MENPLPVAFGHGMPLLDIGTIHLMVALTFLIQALFVALLAWKVGRYRGIRMFFASALVLAAGSGVLFLIPWVQLRILAYGASTLTLWGMALQYTALARFTGRRPSWFLLGGLTVGGSLVLVALALVPGPTPFIAVREALSIPFLFAVALLLRRGDVGEYRLGAVLTSAAFFGYGLLSVVRMVRGFVDPVYMQPGPNLADNIDTLAFFVFGFLWTSGFLFMVNQRLQAELTALATRDPLTDCVNRRAMGELLDAEQDRFARYGRPYTVILLDLDRFKTINDSRGHQTGDQVLVRTAQVLREALRTGDTLARWGGEEFLILLPETQEEAGAALAERLRLQVAGHAFDLGGLDVTFSAGVAGAKTGQTVDSLCHRADQALYAAKETRNRVLLASPPPE